MVLRDILPVPMETACVPNMYIQTDEKKILLCTTTLNLDKQKMRPIINLQYYNLLIATFHYLLYNFVLILAVTTSISIL